MKERIFINRHDYERVILTDILPYEVPLIFSNEGLYHFFKHSYEEAPEFIKKDVLRLKDKNFYKVDYTLPFNYKIKKHTESYRTLSIIHPSLQKQFIDFYKKYDYVMINHCNKSPFTLRKPIRIANTYYEKDYASKKLNSNGIEVLSNGFSKQPKHASSYFSYAKYTFMHKFYNSYEKNRLEKKFSYYMTLDISKCFYNIYTHSLSWAVKEKNYAKKNTGNASFENAFDKLMQKSNFNETNGIVVGPEISRIFAEIIFQKIDLFILEKIKKKYNLIHKQDYDIKRYVDDYFIFTNEENNLPKISKILEDKLEEYKLYFNEAKTKIYSPPFISNISMAKIDIGYLIESKISSYLDIDYENKKITINKINAYYSKANNFISEVKKIIKQNELYYDDVAGYLFSIFKKKILLLLSDEFEIIDKKPLEDFLLYLLDILFFLYAMSTRVNTTYTISHIIVHINKYLNKLPNSIKYDIQKKMFDEIVFIIEKLSYFDKIPNIEVFNLLLVKKELGDKYKLSEKRLRKILNLEIIEDLNYFQIISIFYYIEDDEKYSQFKKDIWNYLITLFEKKTKLLGTNKDDIFIETEYTLLFLDMISCPYISEQNKKKLVGLFFVENIKKMEIINYLNKYVWFSNWSNEISIESLLNKKELKIGYEK